MFEVNGIAYASKKSNKISISLPFEIASSAAYCDTNAN